MTVSCSIRGTQISIKDIYNIPLKSDIISSVYRVVKKEVEAAYTTHISDKN